MASTSRLGPLFLVFCLINAFFGKGSAQEPTLLVIWIWFNRWRYFVWQSTQQPVCAGVLLLFVVLLLSPGGCTFWAIFPSRILPFETLTCSRCDVHFLLQPRDPVDFELPTELIVEQNFHSATNISHSPNITAVVDCEGETNELCTSLLFTAGPGIDAGPGESTPTPGPVLVNGSLNSALPNQTYDDSNVGGE